MSSSLGIRIAFDTRAWPILPSATSRYTVAVDTRRTRAASFTVRHFSKDWQCASNCTKDVPSGGRRAAKSGNWVPFDAP